jgi:hypothetical protein
MRVNAIYTLYDSQGKEIPTPNSPMTELFQELLFYVIPR